MAKRFDYYRRLNAEDRAIYRASDRLPVVVLPNPKRFAKTVAEVRARLEAADRVGLRRGVHALLDQLCAALDVTRPTVRVLSARPTVSGDQWELHGLYEREEGKRPLIKVWMRTAARGDVVAFRTFMRTVIHELCHHLDYERFALADSFHTEAFFRRESALVRQLVGPGRSREKTSGRAQLPLFD